MASGAVVVTGASTGIGRATARHLASLGFDVFAGVRKDSDAQDVQKDGLRPLKIDVADQSSIDAARDEVVQAAGDAGLAGLVNNAGVAVSGPLEFLPIDEVRRQLEINVIGQVAVTQAFLAQLRRARGRIVNISSIGGRVALPLLGPYAASKFALEAISDSLRRELRRFGVEVSVVEPGGIKTPIWDKGNEAADSLLEDAPPEITELYGDMTDRLRKESRHIAEERGLPPEAVAETVGKALTAVKPKTRYLVGRDAKVRAAMAKRLPDRTMDALIGRALGS
jgi:NAD(P)-dependent dehydrogenase (short-subunit alcohol dehydrogenase family)